MTQQLDLLFNTSKSMDKMMSNTSLYSNKDNSFELNNQFGSFLDSANKTYTSNKKTTETKQENANMHKNSNAKNEVKDNYQDKNPKDTKKTDNKTQNDNKEEPVSNDISETKDVKAETVETNSEVISVDNENDENLESMDEVLQESILAANLADTLQFVKIADSETVNQGLLLNLVEDIQEVPAEAIKSGINFDTVLTDLDTETIDMTQAAEVIKDVNVSKEKMIASFYNKDEVKDKTEVVKVSDVVKTEDVSSDVKTEMNDDVVLDVAKDSEIYNEANDNAKVDLQEVRNISQNEVLDNSKTVEVHQEQIVQSVSAYVNETEVTEEQEVTELKQEISSATLENAANKAYKDTKSEQKDLSDKNLKTNVQAEETMDIKDDVTGIEFVNNKIEDKVDNKKVSEKTPEHLKQKVESVKIQVEENVKVNLQTNTEQDVNKIANANETLEKAGLTTENLKKMDAKVKEIDDSGRNAQSDLGQNSKEMLMRDIMQTSASTNESVDLNVDFNQALNKTSQPDIIQTPQTAEEAQEVSILDQIRAKFAANSQNGVQKITIGLTPESLGKLHIEIAKGQNGLSAQIVTENPQAKEILDKNLDGLKNILQTQGVNVNNVNVKVAETGRSSDSNNNMFNSENGQFGSDHQGGNSKNSDDSNKEKRSEYEFLQKEAINNNHSENQEEVVDSVSHVEQTVSIKAGSGNVSYKL